MEERRAAKRVVEEENANHAIEQGYQFELVGWEDTVAQHGRAQEIINRDLDQCNFFVGVVWKRWGSPPGPAGGTYSSGFEEEYERSEERHRKSGKPSISILFKNISDEDKRDVGPQLAKVLDFKKKYTEEYRGAYQTFDGVRDFEQRFRSILAMFLRDEMSEDTSEQLEQKSRTSRIEKKQTQDTTITESTVFEKSARDFVNDIASRSSKETEFEYTPTDAARFRLLANSLQLSQNDNETLGVHDANLIYRDLRDTSLSGRERRGLVNAGVAHFTTRTAPLWHWLYSLDRHPRDELVFLTLVGGESRRDNAFKILGLLEYDLQGRAPPLSRQKLIGIWLNSKSKDLLVSALGYLGECGLIEDITAIDEHLDSSEATVSKAAVSAKVRILMRISIIQALEFIASREDADISSGLLSNLLAKPSTIETNLLKKCLANRSKEFRKTVARELLRRDALDSGDAKILLESSDAETRVLGANALRRLLPEFSLSDARALIVKPKRNNSLVFSDRDHDGEEKFEAYKHEVLRERTYESLDAEMRNDGFYDLSSTFAMYDSQFTRSRKELVSSINDNFLAIAAERKKLLPPASLPDEKTEAYILEKYLQKAVNILSARGSADDLILIRSKIDEGKIAYSDTIRTFLERFGTWEDTKRIIALCNNFPFSGRSLLANGDRGKEYAASAKSLLKLGRDRIGDLLAIEMPSGLLNAVIKEMGANTFKSFDDRQIEKWLRLQTDSVRQTVALKTVLCLPKSRLSNILKNYIGSEDAYYYNVVFWLDLGISTDRATSAKAAQRALSVS